jgi:flagellar hook-length control protein FliK
VFSVSSDIQASTAIQSAAPKANRPDPSQYTDSFSALVDAAIPTDASSSAYSSQPSSAQSSSSQRSSSSTSSGSTTTSRRDTTSSDSTSSNDTSSTTTARSDAADNTTGNTKPSDDKSDTKSDTASSAAKSDGGKSTDKTDQDTSTADDGTAATATVDPTAAVVAVIQSNAAPAITPVAGTTDGTTAIDATAAVVASTQTAGVAVGTAGATDAAVGLLASNAANGNAKAVDPTAKGDVTPSTDNQTAATEDGAPASTPAFAAMIDVTAQTAAKTKAPAQAKTSLTSGLNGTKTDQTTTAAQPVLADAAQPPAPTDKQNAGQVPDPAIGNGGGAPAPAAHDRGGIAPNAQASMPAPDANAQALAAFQPQLSAPPTASISAANLTATVATSAAVPLNGLGVEIAVSALNGKSRFEIRLDPAELGRIDVRIDVDRSGQVTSHLRVEKPETLSMLQQTAPQLQQALNDAGLKTGSGGLQFSLRDQSNSGQNGNNDQSNGNAHRLLVTDDEAMPAASAAGRSYGRMFSSNGGIDIRV